MVITVAALAVSLCALAVLGPGSAAWTVGAITLWGATFTAVPVPCLQSAVLRVAPAEPDTASALYVVAFQIGIGGGALAGSLLVDSGHLGALPVVAAVASACGLLIIVGARRAFPAIQEQAPDACSSPSRNLRR